MGLLTVCSLPLALIQLLLSSCGTIGLALFLAVLSATVGVFELSVKFISGVLLFLGISEPIVNYFRYVIVGTGIDYVSGMKDMLYNGFIRPVFLTIALAVVFVVTVILNLIGCVPLASCVVAPISDILLLFGVVPLGVSMVAFYPVKGVDPIVQEVTTFKMLFLGVVAFVVEFILLVVATVYTIGMLIPIVNIPVAFLAIASTIVLGGISVLASLFLAWIINALFSIPTVFDYHALLGMCGNAVIGIPPTIESLLYRVINACGAWLS